MYCAECKKECRADVSDEGIGRGEAWGAPYNDVRMVILSDCCEALIYDNLDDDDPMNVKVWGLITYLDYIDGEECNEADDQHDRMN